LDQAEQCAQLEGFRQVAQRTELARSSADVPVCAQDDHRDLRPVDPPAHLFGKLPTIHYRHHQIEQDEIRRHCFEDLEGFLAVSGLPDGESLRLEDFGKGLQDIRVVVDHQD